MSRTKSNPTHDEIRERCRDIRRHWDRRERWKRAGKPNPRPWMAPIVHVGEIAAAMSDWQGQGQVNEQDTEGYSQ